MRRLATALTAAALALAAVAAPAGLAQDAPRHPVALTPLEQRVFDLINGWRVADGHRPLAPSPRLQEAARWYARDMAAFDDFSRAHVDTLRRGPAERFEDFGYPRPGDAAENTAAGYATPERTLQQWIDSPPHKATQEGDFAVLGVGIGHNPATASGWFWVASFGPEDDGLIPCRPSSRPRRSSRRRPSRASRPAPAAGPRCAGRARPAGACSWPPSAATATRAWTCRSAGGPRGSPSTAGARPGA